MATAALALAAVALVAAIFGPSQVGPSGAVGDTGATGAKGDKGDTGATGAKGDKGDKGDTGATGAKGDKGDTGATGPPGPPGPVFSASASNSADGVLSSTPFACSAYAPQQLAMTIPATAAGGRIVVTAIVGLDITHSTGSSSGWSLNIATTAIGCLTFGAPGTWTDTIPAAAGTATYTSQTAYLHRGFNVGAAGGTFTFWVVGMTFGNAVNDNYDYVDLYAVFYPA